MFLRKTPKNDFTRPAITDLLHNPPTRHSTINPILLPLVTRRVWRISYDIKVDLKIVLHSLSHDVGDLILLENTEREPDITVLYWP